MLSERQVTYQKASDILNEFLEQNQTENFDLLKESLVENIDLIRYVYSTLFPKIYNRTNVFAIRNKSNFDFSYQLWMSSKTIRDRYKVKEVVEEKKVDVAGKNPTTYEERSNINEFEQKPISIDKYQPTVITAPSATFKSKTTKEMMDAKLEKKREKRAEKKTNARIYASRKY